MRDLLTVQEHARRLGINDQRLRRMLAASERTLRRPLGVRNSRHWLLTEDELRRYLPGLFGGGGLDALEREVREHLRSVDARIDRRAEAVAVRVMAGEREEREAGDVRVAGLVAEVARGFRCLADRVSALESVSDEGSAKNTDGA